MISLSTTELDAPQQRVCYEKKEKKERKIKIICNKMKKSTQQCEGDSIFRNHMLEFLCCKITILLPLCKTLSSCHID